MLGRSVVKDNSGGLDPRRQPAAASTTSVDSSSLTAPASPRTLGGSGVVNEGTLVMNGSSSISTSDFGRGVSGVRNAGTLDDERRQQHLGAGPGDQLGHPRDERRQQHPSQPHHRRRVRLRDGTGRGRRQLRLPHPQRLRQHPPQLRLGGCSYGPPPSDRGARRRRLQQRLADDDRVQPHPRQRGHDIARTVSRGWAAASTTPAVAPSSASPARHTPTPTSTATRPTTATSRRHSGPSKGRASSRGGGASAPKQPGTRLSH